jgi:hypothetical protein
MELSIKTDLVSKALLADMAPRKSSYVLLLKVNQTFAFVHVGQLDFIKNLGIIFKKYK